MHHIMASMMMERLQSSAEATSTTSPSLPRFHWALQQGARRHAQQQQQRAIATAARKARRPQGKQGSGSQLGIVEVDADGSDVWRLAPVAECLQLGGVGIIPTDTFPAFVCDLANKASVQRLYQIKGMSLTQPLSILCNNFQDISTYTLGFPASNAPGQPDTFRIARQVLPGPYTFILLAGKALPKQCVDYLSGKSKTRRSVGVRMPSDVICQAILEQLERPLLCSSIRPADQLSGALPEAALLLDDFESRGLDFIVDNGRQFAEGSTVIDMTSGSPAVLRRGLGDASMFVDEGELAFA